MIEIKDTPENLERISIFLENNNIKHRIGEDVGAPPVLKELEETIDWPL